MAVGTVSAKSQRMLKNHDNSLWAEMLVMALRLPTVTGPVGLEVITGSGG